MHKFDKVYALGNAEVSGILTGEVWVYPKVDGANARVGLENGQLRVGGRNHEVACDGREFDAGMGTQAFEQRESYTRIIEKYQQITGGEITLIGEWMRKHTINYAINKPYLIFYDAYVLHPDPGQSGYVSHYLRQQILDDLEEAGIAVLTRLAVLMNPTMEQIMEYVGKPSVLNPDVIEEGVVLYNPDFRNAYGRQAHAKIVSDNFKEVKTKAWTPKQRIERDYNYTDVVEQFVTVRRIEKLLQKENLPCNLASMKYLSKVLIDDILQEHILDIKACYEVVDFIRLNKQICMKTVSLLNTSNLFTTQDSTVVGE